jgi:hypothetical protein
MRLSAEQRFLSKTRRNDESGCIEWTASKNRSGYGKFGCRTHWIFAHRFAYEMVHGAIPGGKFVLHHCDNPCCVNVEHLYLGSKKDNARDREARNRGNHVSGTKHGRNKLLQMQVLEIRDAFDTGKYSFRKLGKIYGINGKSVADIVDRKNWNHII